MKRRSRRFRHTVKIAFSINAWIEDDQGQRLEAWLLPVHCLFFWIPAWLYKSLMRKLSARRPATPRRPWPLAWLALLFDLAGWKNDLPVILLAGRLLLKERRFAYG